MTETPDLDLISLTADITSAYLGNNKVATGDVADLIGSIHHALQQAGSPVTPATSKQEPAVSIRASVKPDSIACFECGQKAKMLKRHLQTAHGLAPAAYREKWALPRDYPLVASNYAAQRSTLAKTIGLGRRKVEAVADSVVEPVKKAGRKLSIFAAKAAASAHLGTDTPAPAKRGRPSKAQEPAAVDPASASTVESPSDNG
jgi:predicted transcriptional regulator